jgi:hypothetical protein
MTSEEDEAWHLIDRTYTLNRKRQIENQMRDLTDEMNHIRVRLGDLEVKTSEEFYNELRNNILQEVADWVRTMPGFGQDTLDSFHIRIMGMKR